MRDEHPPPDRRKPSPLKIASYAGVAIAAILLLSVLAILLFPNPLMNRFVKPRITEAFAEACPGYEMRIGDMKCSIVQNRFELDSVTVSAVDGTFSGSVDQFSVSAIGWMHLLWGGSHSPAGFANAVVDAQEIALNFPESKYELHCGLLQVSVPDSEIVVEALTVHPSGDDEQWFAGSKFRTTRLRLVVPHASVAGLACLELMQGKNYRTRSVNIHELFLDVLINKDKVSAKAVSSPLMPNELLSSMAGTLQVDSLSIVNGQLKYGERFAVGSKPALIFFDSVQVLAEGIANHGDSGAVIVVHAQGTFMKAGTMKVLLSIPVASREFSFQYSGSLSRTDLRALNPFLETAEQMRIVAGVLQAATFEITVASGRANGHVRVVYRDLTLAVIDRNTGSQKGFVDGIASFIANTFKIRGTNVPDKSGAMKIGVVKYTRQRDDPFFRFLWFSLRSGVGDVAGF